MRFLLTLLLAFVLVLPVHAQVPLLPAEEPAAAAEPTAAVDDLIRILEDDTARAALIEQLRQTAPAESAAAEDSAGPDLSIARQLAEYTRSVAQGTSSTVRSLGEAALGIGALFQGGVSSDLRGLRDLAVNLGILVVALFGSFFLLRLASNIMGRRLAARAAGQGAFRRFGALVLALLLDAATVVIAWAVAYVVALNFGTTVRGEMGINQSLLINAFLVVEISKLALRLLLAPRYTSLRILPVTDENAAYWSFWLGRIVGLIGYGIMFVAPLVSSTVSRPAGGAVQVLTMLTAAVMAIIIVLQNRDSVRLWLTDMSTRHSSVSLWRLLGFFAQVWHMVAIAYILAVLVVWFANPEGALPFMISATVQSVIAIVVGTVIVVFIGRFVSAGFHLPDDVRQRLPGLEGRLRTFVPGVMAVVRWIAIVAVVAAIGQAWALYDFAGWIGSPEGLAVAGSVVSAALIVLAAIALHLIVSSWVEYRLNTSIGKQPTAREKTLLNLFRNAFTIALVVFGLMLALAQIGVNIAPLLAGAGVVGLAIGFGAQKLVQDIITGIFIQFENIMNEGDVVEAAGRSGVVERLTIRSVTIRDMTGTVHLIPFSSVDQVSNMMRGFSFYVSEVEIAYDSDIEAAKQAMRDAFAMVMEHDDYKNVILDDLDLQGLIAITPASVSLRSRIKTLAGKQWGAGRYYSEQLMRLFAERGIETPTPKVSYVPGRGGSKSYTQLPPLGEEPA